MPATRDYCTLFDVRYLPRALALYRSLERLGEDFALTAVCMDERSRELLERLSLAHLRVLPIAEVERFDPQLLAVRQSRTSWEYCWTSTSAVCRFLLATEPGLQTLTYLDADLHFSSSPSPLFAELGDGSILLIPHRTDRETEDAVGIYNIGWITFRNDERSRVAIEWWRERCLEWCYDRVEPGRYGDQKYLDDWPSRFDGVRVSALTCAGLGPWNDDRHVFSAAEGDCVLADGSPLIYYHHSGLHTHRVSRFARLLARRSLGYRIASGPVELAWMPPSAPPAAVMELVWAPYAQSLTEALGELNENCQLRDVGLDSVSLTMAGRYAVKRRVPALAANAYGRLPLALRHRIWRTLTPS